MREQLLQLQSQRQSLRLQLKHKSRFNQFDNDFERKQKLLEHLDGLFSRLCKENGLRLNKNGLLL
jgi:hypothetical protein